MKKRSKFTIIGLSLLVGTFALTGCTASFCSVNDKAHMLYAIDYGVTQYFDENSTAKPAYAYIDGEKIEIKNVSYVSRIEDFNDNLTKINETANKSQVSGPDILYWETIDAVVLGHAITAKGLNFEDAKNLKAAEIRRDFKDSKSDSVVPEGLLDTYGYLKYADSTNNEKDVLWTNYYSIVNEVREILGKQGKIDCCATTDYTRIYVNTLDTTLNSYRSCITLKDGSYGTYGQKEISINIEGKKWKDWKGLFEFLLVYPIAAFVEVLTNGLIKIGVANGAAQLLSILIVTMVIRVLMFLATFKSTKQQSKLTSLQPEISKIQAKYPNANTSRYEKERMAAEMAALYKKHGAKPLSSLLTLIIQFPVFICVWGALQGSAILSTGTFLGLSLSSSIGATIRNKAAWTATGGAPTALILFLLMAGAQTVSMLLPQILQKKKAKKVAKLGKNPSVAQQDKRTKWFTYIMLVMIIIMGFSLVSAMGVYWLVGAIFSIIQTLIMERVNNRRKAK